MPHCFAMVLEGLHASRMFFDHWSGFIDQVVKNPESIETKGSRIAPKTLEVTELNVKTLAAYGDDEVMQRMKERVQVMSMKQPDPISKL